MGSIKIYGCLVFHLRAFESKGGGGLGPMGIFGGLGRFLGPPFNYIPLKSAAEMSIYLGGMIGRGG